MTFRTLTVVAHRWLGLAASLVIVIAGLTGALLAWPTASPWGIQVSHWHVNLGLGRPGALVVLLATWISVGLIASGLYLWWKTKTVRVRTRSGWRAFVIDLHYSLGAITLLITLLIAATGALRPILPQSQLRRAVSRLHTTVRFPAPIKMIYVIGSLAVAVQGVTGVVMWAAKQRTRRRVMNLIVPALIALPMLGLTSACRPQDKPSLDPEAVRTVDAFFAALTARNVASLEGSLAETVQVGGDSGFAGAPRSGFVSVERAQLAEAYRSLFNRLGAAGWASVMDARKPLLNVAVRDGHHADYAKAGDYVFELGRPPGAKFEPILVFIFRKIAGKYLVVAQHTTFERPSGIAQSGGR